MALSSRRRGEIYHARGTVRVGRQIVHVAEVSTGCRRRADAEAWISGEEARIRAEIIDGPAGRARSVTVAECLLAYLERPGGVRPRDQQPIRDINAAFGARPLAEAPAAWREWLAAHPQHSAGTRAKYRTILSAALRFGARELETEAPRLEGIRVPRNEKITMLTELERARVLEAYSPAAGRVALVLAYQGMRTTETLRLDWRDISLEAQTIRARAENTKSARGRAIPMHPRVLEMLAALSLELGNPRAGPVFFSSRGAPFSDQREAGGGSPLATAHATACRKAGVTGFRLHDWRHDWAARMVMAGTDLYTLMRLGGWASLRMVERYASVTADHMREAVKRIA